MKDGKEKIIAYAPHILLTLFFAALTLWLTHPLSRHMDDAMSYTRTPMQGWEQLALYQGDHLQLYYHFWMAYDYLHTGGDFFSAPYEFQFKDMSIFTTRRLLISLPFVGLALCFGPVTAYNLLTLLSVFLCGLGMYMCALHFFRSRAAAAVAGVIFASAPYTLGQLLGGHTNGFLVWTIPFIYVWTDKLVETRKTRYALFLLPVLATFALIEYHLLYYTLLFLPPFALLLAAVRLAQNENDYAFDCLRDMLRPALCFTAVLAVSAGILLYIKHVEIGPSTEKAGRALSEVALNSPHPRDFLRKDNPDLEKNIYAGLPLIGLCLAALLGALAKLLSSLFSEQNMKARLRTLAVLFYGAALLVFSTAAALGTSLHFPLYRLCYRFVPYFNFSRSPSRVFVFALFCAALLIAWMLTRVRAAIMISTARHKRVLYPALCAAACAGLLYDVRPLHPVGICMTDGNNPLYEFVGKNTASNEKVLMLPLWPGDSAWSSVYQYYVTTARVRMINGYYPLVPERYVAEVFRPLMSLNAGSMNREQYGILRAEKLRFIILHMSTFPQKVSNYPAVNTIQRLKASPYLKFLRAYRDQYLFELAAPEEIDTGKEGIITPVTGVFFEDSMFRHRHGRKTADLEAADGYALLFPKTVEPGSTVLGGRKQILPEGDYKVWFRIRAEGLATRANLPEDNGPADSENPDEHGNPLVCTLRAWDSTDRENRRELARLEIRAQDIDQNYGYQLLPMSCASAFQPEFTITTGAAGADLFFDNLYMLENSQSDPLGFIEAEQSFCAPQTVIVDDEEARDNRAVASLRKITGKTHFEICYGPYRRFKPGYYKISFRMRAANCAGAAVADLEVTSSWGRHKITSRRIFQSDLHRPDKYEDFELFFGLERDEVLEFRAIGLSPCDLYIDCFKIERSEQF